MLFGWDGPTWQRALEWARAVGIPTPTSGATLPESQWSALAAIRSKWLEMGGPESGPSGAILLTADN